MSPLKNVYAEPISDNSGKYISLKSSKSGELQRLLLMPAEPQHRSFIISTWVRSVLTLKPTCIQKSVFLEGESHCAEQQVAAGNCWVLTDPEDNFVVLAWICGIPGLVHYVYVVPDFRCKGVCGAMLELVCQKEKGLQNSRQWPWKQPSWSQYNPYRLFQIA